MSSSPPAGQSARGPSGSFPANLLLGAAALTIVLAGMRGIQDIVGPVVLAVVLTVTLHPIRMWLEEHRLPEWAASVLMLLAVYTVLLLLSLALMVSVAQLADLIPQYTAEIKEQAGNVASTLEGLGVQQAQIDAVASAVDPGQVVDVAMELLFSTLGVLTNLFFLLTVLLFMAFDTNKTRRSLAWVGRRFPSPVKALDSFAHGTRSYMGVSAAFGLIVAVIDGVVLYAMGVPGAFVWAVLAFVTNFIPNIGFVIGVIPPALIALLDSGPALMLAVIAVYSVINFVIQSIIQPRVVGDTVGLTPTITFLSLVFWTWLIGPLGALLAVPLSLLVRALLVEAEPSAAWAIPLISGKVHETDDPESTGEPADTAEADDGRQQAPTQPS